MLRRIAITTLAAAAVLSTATVVTAPLSPAEAQVTVTFGPPAPVYEPIPAPRPGYTWAQGHHRYDGNRYVWVPGRWVAARSGYRYVPDRWEQVTVAGRQQWRHVPSRWDRDGDGIPNRRDRFYTPRWDRDGDGIPNGRDHYDNRRHDRDGDGIPNRRDRDDRHDRRY